MGKLKRHIGSEREPASLQTVLIETSYNVMVVINYVIVPGILFLSPRILHVEPGSDLRRNAAIMDATKLGDQRHSAVLFFLQVSAGKKGGIISSFSAPNLLQNASETASFDGSQVERLLWRM